METTVTDNQEACIFITYWFVSPTDLIITIPHWFDDLVPDKGILNVVVYAPFPSLSHDSECPTTYIRPLNGSTVRSVTFIYCSEHITITETQSQTISEQQTIFIVWKNTWGLIYRMSTTSRPVVQPNQPPIKWVLGDLSPGLMRPGCEDDPSYPTSAEFKKGGTITPLPHMSPWSDA